MLHNLFLKTLRDYRYALLGWAIGFIFISFYLMYFYPFISRTTEILDVIDRFPPIIKNLIGKKFQFSTPAGFFSIQPFSMMAPLLFLLFGISKAGDAIAGENERGTLDLLLAHPVPRERIVIEKIAAIGLSLLFLAIIFWISMVLSSVIFHIALNIIHLAEAIFSCFMLGMFFSAFTMSLSCLYQRKKTIIGFISGFAIVTYLINAYAPMVKELQPYRIFSPFYYYNGAQPLLNGLNLSHFLILLLLILVFFILSIFFFKRADLFS